MVVSPSLSYFCNDTDHITSLVEKETLGISTIYIYRSLKGSAQYQSNVRTKQTFIYSPYTVNYLTILWQRQAATLENLCSPLSPEPTARLHTYPCLLLRCDPLTELIIDGSHCHHFQDQSSPIPAPPGSLPLPPDWNAVNQWQSLNRRQKILHQPGFLNNYVACLYATPCYVSKADILFQPLYLLRPFYYNSEPIF